MEIYKNIDDKLITKYSKCDFQVRKVRAKVEVTVKSTAVRVI